MAIETVDVKQVRSGLKELSSKTDELRRLL
jgi:hypothetical protein